MYTRKKKQLIGLCHTTDFVALKFGVLVKNCNFLTSVTVFVITITPRIIVALNKANYCYRSGVANPSIAIDRSIAATRSVDRD